MLSVSAGRLCHIDFSQIRLSSLPLRPRCLHLEYPCLVLMSQSYPPPVDREVDMAGTLDEAAEVARHRDFQHLRRSKEFLDKPYKHHM